MKRNWFCVLFSFMVLSANAQSHWINLDSLYQPLPSSVHVYKSTDLIHGKTNIMYYAIANLGKKDLKFTADTTYKRRLTPS